MGEDLHNYLCRKIKESKMRTNPYVIGMLEKTSKHFKEDNELTFKYKASHLTHIAEMKKHG